MQSTPKDAIAEILNSFDLANDAIWTDDGAPLVSEVQRLANDTTITRAQINEAIPGFTRKGNKADGSPAIAGSVSSLISSAETFDDRMEPEVKGAGEPLTEDEVRAILTRRIRDAEDALTNARRTTSESRQEELRCEARLNRAHIDYQRKYPPISAAQNIQDHLKRQQELLMERVTGNKDGRSQIDISMERSNRRGWTRPTRPVNNANTAA